MTTENETIQLEDGRLVSSAEIESAAGVLSVQFESKELDVDAALDAVNLLSDVSANFDFKNDAFGALGNVGNILSSVPYPPVAAAGSALSVVGGLFGKKPKKPDLGAALQKLGQGIIDAQVEIAKQSLKTTLSAINKQTDAIYDKIDSAFDRQNQIQAAGLKAAEPIAAAIKDSVQTSYNAMQAEFKETLIDAVDSSIANRIDSYNAIVNESMADYNAVLQSLAGRQIMTAESRLAETRAYLQSLKSQQSQNIRAVYPPDSPDSDNSESTGAVWLLAAAGAGALFFLSRRNN